MINTAYFKDKKVVVVGLARSGLSCANLLFDLGSDIYITDNQDTEATRLNAAKLKSKDIKVELGRHSVDFIKGSDLVIISPGVTDKAPPIVWAKEFNIPVISEIEFAWTLCPATVIAVTGSNGKTTVATLIGKVLSASGRRVFTCGNIGNPFSGELQRMEAGDFVSLEVSSFQLEKIQRFKPKIAVILNFSRNHLDRYKDMDEYLQAKKRIFMNQDKSDYLVLNSDDPILMGLAKEARANTVFFSQGRGLNPNHSAVLAVASVLGIEEKACLSVFKDFRGIEHRLEQVADINDIIFINDSKATTVDSCLWALKNISRPIVLIAGGKDKGSDYSFVLGLVREKVKALVLIGQAKKKIREALKGYQPVEEAFSLEEAVSVAFKKARPGDCVLLSPMCSSFDMFSDYEDRGRVFKRAVADLARREA